MDLNDKESFTPLNDAPESNPFTKAETIILGVLIWLLFIIGIAFNVVTIIVIKSSKELRTEFMRIIFFLCISDLLSAIISPFVWYRDTLGYDVYNIPHGFCNLTWGMDIMTSQATALMIMMLAIIRYIAIQFPIKYRRINRVHTMCAIAFIWLISFGFGFIPMTIYMKVVAKNRTNVESPASKWPACSVDETQLMSFATFISYATPIFFYLPTFLVITFSLLIGCTIFINRTGIMKTENGSPRVNPQRVKRQIYVAKQLALIIFSFLVGYIPFTAYSFWTMNSQADIRTDSWFATGAYLCTRMSECMNPVFYNAGSPKMRKCTMDYFTKLIPCCLNVESTPRKLSNVNTTKIGQLTTVNDKQTPTSTPSKEKINNLINDDTLKYDVKSKEQI